MSRSERFSRWLAWRYGAVGRDKPIWALLVESVLMRVRPRRAARRMFLGEPPPTLLP